jgi:hypothetical protein
MIIPERFFSETTWTVETKLPKICKIMIVDFQVSVISATVIFFKTQ